MSADDLFESNSKLEEGLETSVYKAYLIVVDGCTVSGIGKLSAKDFDKLVNEKSEQIKRLDGYEFISKEFSKYILLKIKALSEQSRRKKQADKSKADNEKKAKQEAL